MTKLMEVLSRVAFASAGLVLMALSLTLVVSSVVEVVTAASVSRRDFGDAVLLAIGFVVIALAVFDVAKYFIEEEVIRVRELRRAGEARRSLTKFIATISIAVFVEGLVTVFRVSHQDVNQLLFPTLLLLTAIVIVVGLGIFQRLSAEVEREVESRDKKRG